MTCYFAFIRRATIISRAIPDVGRAVRWQESSCILLEFGLEKPFWTGVRQNLGRLGVDTHSVVSACAPGVQPGESLTRIHIRGSREDVDAEAGRLRQPWCLILVVVININVGDTHLGSNRREEHKVIQIYLKKYGALGRRQDGRDYGTNIYTS